jgi:hypothetical protein
MSVGVVFAGPVVMVVIRVRIKGRQLLEPLSKIMMQPSLVVVDEHRCGDVHGIHQHEPFLNSARAHGVIHLGRDVAKRHLRRNVDSEIFGM